MQKRSDKFQPGTRIFYTGDQANGSSYGTITAYRPRQKYGPESVDIKFDDPRFEGDADQSTKGIYLTMFDQCPGRRFWLANDYEADRNAKIAEAKEFYARMAEKRRA